MFSLVSGENTICGARARQVGPGRAKACQAEEQVVLCYFPPAFVLGVAHTSHNPVVVRSLSHNITETQGTRKKWENSEFREG